MDLPSKRLTGRGRLRNHDAALELADHIGMQAHFGGPLRQGHLVDLILQLEQSVKEALGARRAADYVNIHGDYAIDTLQDRIGIERTASAGACPHGDAPLWVR